MNSLQILNQIESTNDMMVDALKMAIALGKPLYELQELVRFYENENDKLFQQLWNLKKAGR